jgi:hypothetical protein
MARLSRECIITEKIDGTNASIYIAELPNDHPIPKHSLGVFDIDGKLHYMAAGSRTRWITPNDDNYGFATWAMHYNFDELKKLGVGHHFGEWWGSGIQRNYGFKNGERFFSLFNAGRWVKHDQPTSAIPSDNPTAPPKFTQKAPSCCKVVPILDRCLFDETYDDVPVADYVLRFLKKYGSVAAAGFMNPEGIIVYHVAAGIGFKKTLDNDDQPKGKQSL